MKPHRLTSKLLPAWPRNTRVMVRRGRRTHLRMPASGTRQAHARDPGAESTVLYEDTTEVLVADTASGESTGFEARQDVTVLNVFRDIATVIVRAEPWSNRNRHVDLSNAYGSRPAGYRAAAARSSPDSVLGSTRCTSSHRRCTGHFCNRRDPRRTALNDDNSTHLVSNRPPCLHRTIATDLWCSSNLGATGYLPRWGRRAPVGAAVVGASNICRASPRTCTAPAGARALNGSTGSRPLRTGRFDGRPAHPRTR